MEVCEDTCLGKYWVNSWSKNSRKIKTERKRERGISSKQ